MTCDHDACPPDPPAGSPAVYPGIGTATVTWRSPPYDGGCMVTGYSVEMRRSSEDSWTVVAEACHSLSHTVNGLEPEEVYLFRVRAENIHGASEPGLETRPVTIAEDEQQFKPAFEAREVTIEDGQLFKDRYEVLEELGKGRYGIVRKVTEKSTGQHLAAKFIRTIKAKDKEQVNEEIRIMNLLRHPKLLQLAAAFESPREVVMIMEYISGGELFERVVADDFTLTERDSILFMRQICEGVQYMHENNVVHLDLKPENIMCHTRTSHQIKLIDFGLAQMLKPGTPIRVLFGTPEFIPPEIINYEPIGTDTDMWSVGVICYVLLTGLSPFMGENDAETFANITRADYDFDDEAFDAISQDAKDFISSLLEKRKELRMSAKQCLQHPWVAQHSEKMSLVVLPTDKLKKFIIRRKWQKTGNAIRALGRMATLSANSRRNSSTNESSPTRSLSPLVSLDEDVLSSAKMIKEPEISTVEPTADLNVEEIEKDSVVVKNEENGNLEEEEVQGSNKNPRIISSDDSCLRTEKLNDLGAKDPRLGKSSELIIEDIGSTDYLGVNIEFCNLSKSEPDDIYLSNNNVVEVSNTLNEADPEETYPSSVVEPEEDISSSRRSTTELVHSTVIEDVCLNGFKDFNLKRTRACSERSDSGISDCSSAALYSQGGELSSLTIAEEDEDSHGSSFGIKLRTSLKKTSSTSYEISKTISTHGTDYLVRKTAAEKKETTSYYDEFSRPKISHGSNHRSTINALKSTYDDPESRSKPRLSTGLRFPREILRSKFERSKSVFDSNSNLKTSGSHGHEHEPVTLNSQSQISLSKSRNSTLTTNKETNTHTIEAKSNSNFLAFLAPDEDQDSGLIRGQSRVHTGSVSRTARMFEREELSPTKEIPTSLPRVTPSVPGKPHNDRIQKAFAFWNK